MPRLPQPGRSSRRGVVLLAVLVVVTVLTLAGYQYSEWVTAEYRAASSYSHAAQARALAESGVHYAAALLASPDAVANTLNNNPFDNPQAFESVTVPGMGNGPPGRFSVVAVVPPDDPSGVPYRFGVVDEAGKINLNALLQLDNGQGNKGQQLLLALPNMSEEVANAILDWIDPDDQPRSNGAESDFYTGQSPPYQCKNGPFDTLEELLLVKGVTPELLFGADRNRNGMGSPASGGGEGPVDQGWSAYLTVYSRESNLDATGNPRIYLNDSDLNALTQNLTNTVGQDLANYIIAYRMYGPASGGSSSGGGRSGGGGGGGGSGGSPSRLSGAASTAVMGQMSSDRSKSGSGGGGKNRISSVFDLINSSVNVTSGSGRSAQTTPYPSPLNDPGQQRQLLPLLLDKTTTKQQTDLSPRININTASPVVLQALTAVGLDPSDVETILSQRPAPGSQSDPMYQTAAWLIVQANMQPATLKKLEPYITSRTQVYRLQSVGYLANGPSARVEAVVDANNGRPRIVYWRNLTELGRGFNFAGPH